MKKVLQTKNQNTWRTSSNHLRSYHRF